MGYEKYNLRTLGLVSLPLTLTGCFAAAAIWSATAPPEMPAPAAQPAKPAVAEPAPPQKARTHPDDGIEDKKHEGKDNETLVPPTLQNSAAVQTAPAPETLSPENKNTGFAFDALRAEFYGDFPDLKSRVTFHKGGNLAFARQRWGESLIEVHVPLEKLYDAQDTLIDYFIRQTGLKDDMVLPEDPVYRNDAYCRQFVFDHEVGHALHFAYYPDEIDSDRQMESFGDAYAMCRHLQRFGTDTGFPEAWVLSRARLVGHVHNWYGQSHMTVACLVHMMTMDRGQIAALTPREMAALAAKITLERGLTRKQDRLLAHWSDDLWDKKPDEKMTAFARFVLEEQAGAAPAKSGISQKDEAVTSADRDALRPIVLCYLQSLKMFYRWEPGTAQTLDDAIRAVTENDPALLKLPKISKPDPALIEMPTPPPLPTPAHNFIFRRAPF